MDNSTIRAEVVQHFGQLDASLLNEVASTCRSHNLPPENYYYRWEAYVLSHHGPDGSIDVPFNLDNARELRRTMTSELARAGIKQETKIAPLGGVPKKAYGKGIDDDLGFTPSRTKPRISNPPAAQSKGSWAGSSSTATPKNAFSPALVKTEAVTPLRPQASSSAAFSSPEEKKAFDGPASTANTDAGFLARQGALTILESLNGTFPPAAPSFEDRSRIQLRMDADPKEYNYRYMFEKLSERSAVLDTLIEDAAVLLCNWYGADSPEDGDETVVAGDDVPFPRAPDAFGDPTVTGQGPPIWAVGRLCPEPSATNTSTNDPNAKGASASVAGGSSVNKLSEKGCFLEGSRMGTGGRRAWLEFDRDLVVRGTGKSSGGVGLFPGALVAVKGRNGGGKVFTVKEIVTMPPVEPPFSKPDQLLNYQYGENKLNGQPLKVVIAAGPYTTDDSFEYLPLQALVDELVQDPPDLLMLLGPFVDSHHPMIKSGHVDAFPTDIFRSRVSPLIRRLVETCRQISAILLPSTRDLITPHLAFPQSPLPPLDLPKRAKLLPNPAAFTVNEVGIAATSADTLMAVRQTEWFRPAKESELEEGEFDPSAKEAIPRACRHVMRQRSFYPIFPPAAAPHLETVNLDITHYDHLRYAGTGLGSDVLVLPSSLTPFAKVVDSTIVVNPGQLAKGKRTFARLAVHPMDRRELEKAVSGKMEVDDGTGASVEMDHRVFERCRVDIVRV